MKNAFVQNLISLLNKRTLSSVKNKIAIIQSSLPQNSNNDTAHINAELQQILASRTLERAHYYIRRLIKGLTKVKNGKLNDLNLNRWKDYEDIITDSLWLLDKRDRSGVHSASYWGNFAPQIPNQLIRRFTKTKEWVLDPFLGSGTTLIECKRLGRNGVGVELQTSVFKKTTISISEEKNIFQSKCHVINDDSAHIDLAKEISRFGVKSVQFVLLHPPYWDIIKFSRNNHDLSNAASLDAFISDFGKVVKNCAAVLDNDRYLAVVIGDKYSAKEWTPLGFLSMQEVLKHGFRLKSVIVKNFNQTKAKRNQQKLWRYRALVGGFYVFKHEYIFLFQKT